VPANAPGWLQDVFWIPDDSEGLMQSSTCLHVSQQARFLYLLTLAPTSANMHHGGLGQRRLASPRTFLTFGCVHTCWAITAGEAQEGLPGCAPFMPLWTELA